MKTLFSTSHPLFNKMLFDLVASNRKPYSSFNAIIVFLILITVLSNWKWDFLRVLLHSII